MHEDQVVLQRMLETGVPVTLLLDLLAPPNAREVYSVEGGAADWLVVHAGAA